MTNDHEGLTLRDDRVVCHDGFPVGEYADNRITLNLGWCRLAGLSLRVEDDPQTDRHRDGHALDRTVPPRA